MTVEQLGYLQAWQKSAHDAGMVGCDYPRAVGGGGRKDCQRIANEEMQRAGAPYFANIIGLGMAAPTVVFHAREELKRALLPKLFSGEEIWCQGLSEPGAGSDLASVQTFAERRGERWVINDHKVWTSLAHFASWMILLARTDRSTKYDGLIVRRLAASLNDDGILIVSGPTESALYRLGRCIAGCGGHYHKQTVYDVEAATAQVLEPADVVRVPPLVPLFRISLWRRRLGGC